jgi:hypothetical protein
MPSRLEEMQETFAPLTWPQREIARAWVLKALAESATDEQWSRALREAIEVSVPRSKPAPAMDRKTASTGETEK